MVRTELFLIIVGSSLIVEEFGRIAVVTPNCSCLYIPDQTAISGRRSSNKNVLERPSVINLNSIGKSNAQLKTPGVDFSLETSLLFAHHQFPCRLQKLLADAQSGGFEGNPDGPRHTS